MSNQLSLSLNKKPGANEEVGDTLDTSQTDEQSLSQPISEHQQIHEQFKGAFLGAAIGDALGFITEFMRNRGEIQKQFGTSRLTELMPWQRITTYPGKKRYRIELPLPAGAYSDDTQLTIATARSLQADGSFDVESFAKLELPIWLHYQLGGGSGTKAAAKNLTKKSVSWNNNFYALSYTRYTDSGGNGAAMRILPIALANAHNDDLMYRNVWKNAITTHGHPRAIIGALLFADAIANLLHKPSGKKAWLNYLIGQCDRKYPELLEKWADCPEFSAWEQAWSQNTQKRFETDFRKDCNQTAIMLEMIRGAATRFHQKADSQGFIEEYRNILSELGCYDQSTKGAGNSTVVAAAFFFTVFPTYEESITAIANEIGIDTDTIGYFAGAMYGVAYGVDKIPKHLTEKIQDSAYLLSLAEACYHIYFGQATHEESFKYPALKSARNLQSHPRFSNGAGFQLGATVDLPVLGSGKIAKDTNLTPNWRGKHVHFIEVHLELGQTIFLQIDQSVPSDKHQHSTTAEKESEDEWEQSETNLLTILDGYRDKIEQSDFAANSILEVLRNIKFEFQDKALYDAFATWLWGALPPGISQEESENEHSDSSDSADLDDSSVLLPEQDTQEEQGVVGNGEDERVREKMIGEESQE